MEFCKSPEPFHLVSIFEKLINPPGVYYFVYFSDDSCLSVRTTTGVQMYNLDISSCDGSHGPAVFQAFAQLFPERTHSTVALLIEQCFTPVRIYSVDDPRQYVELQPKTPFLYSGSTITTAINNFACQLFMSSIADVGDFSTAGIIAGGERAGYILTVQACESYHDLQFLKHSPVRDVSGCLRPLLNVGVLLRLSGCCRGDLANFGGKGKSLKDRAAIFQASLLVSAYPRAHFTLIDMMKKRFSLGSRTLDLSSIFEYKIGNHDDYPAFVVSDFEVYRRYRLTEIQVIEINMLLGNLGYGQLLSTSGLSAILFADYGLSCATQTVPAVLLPPWWKGQS